MTLIVSFSVDDTWFLLGDLLVSTPAPHSQPVHLPSVGDPTALMPASSRYLPYSLSRKVSQFSNLAIAWSGRYLDAKRLISRLFEYTREAGPIDFATLDRFLNKEAASSDLHLLGYLLDPTTGSGIGFGLNHTEYSSAMLRNLRLAGSGQSLFMSYFSHDDQSAIDLLSPTSATPFETSVAKALAIAGMLLQLELGTHKTLAHYFGGGYELVALNRRRFILCGDLIYLFWHARIDDDELTLAPVMKFFKHSYHDDILMIRTLEMNAPDPDNPLFLTRRTDEVHYFPPIYKTLTDEQRAALPKPDLTASFLSTHILVQSVSGVEVLTRLDWSKTCSIPLRFVNDGTTMSVELRGDYISGIFEAIERRKPTPPPSPPLTADP